MALSALSDFHPATARWFADAFDAPTPAQLRGWAAIRERRATLIAAPTGSGKTLAAFLTALDDLLQEGLRSPLPDEVRVIYVSPLKALSADIEKNLAEPRRGLRHAAEAMGLHPPQMTVAVRTGDTPPAERAAMLRTPPHILVTTPESLYLMLTAARSREILRTVRTVIVDEIHAVIGTRRGAHLALSLERLEQIALAPPLRIGLSATQRPVEDVARFLVGTRRVDADGQADCVIVDEGHRRAMDLDLELPRSPLEAVMSHEVWAEYYDRLATLVLAHRTTLVFVNTRRMAERLARHLSERLGTDAVTAHHGSLSKDKRLDAETRLKAGQLRALVATASLELGIDIGHVDLVCQIGSPHRIATFIQRVGRSGHSVAGTPIGRLFPVSRDDLVECTALIHAVRTGNLDRIVSHDSPLDVLAQQVVAETACREYGEDELFAVARAAWPFRNLDRRDFDAVVAMTAEGFSTRRGRRGALVHRDEVHGRLKGRRGARLLALTSGGAIPEVADYRVVLDPEDTFIGTLNEDFAIESTGGDVFQLGNASWRVLQVGAGTVRVADAKGAPPNLPFWLGEAPGRSDELSAAVSDLRREMDARLDESTEDATTWLTNHLLMPAAAADQIVAYLADARRSLGVLPTQDTLVLERFFDESGGMQLVLHAPFGSRVNKAWGLALRKRFCRQFNFELQAAATEDALLLSLGPQHSFPLADVFRYLSPATARDVLVQAFLDAPVFQTRWRWNTTISLAVPRNRGGKKVPPQLQRMLADDLLASVFPDAAACLENIPGDRDIPDHPLVAQTVRDCLDEAMDFAGLESVLTRIQRGDFRLISRDTPEPSPLAHEILNARPYAFLDDAPLEERRTQAVYTRRTTEAASAADLGALDPDAIARVRDEVKPDPRDVDELHDALLTAGFLGNDECVGIPTAWFDELRTSGRAAVVTLEGRPIWVAAERLPEMQAVHPTAAVIGFAVPPPARASRVWSREDAVAELLRNRFALTGPITAAAIAATLAIGEDEAHATCLALESEGALLRGHFTSTKGSKGSRGSTGSKGSCSSNGSSSSTGSEPVEPVEPLEPIEPLEPLEWCDRRLLARIHRYTLNRLRAEIEPVSPADFMRFLFAWQHVERAHRVTGIDGLRAIVAALDGYELAASAWERSVLPARMEKYEPGMLDMLCLTGEVGWARLSKPQPAHIPAGRLVGTTPVALFLREHGRYWQAMRDTDEGVSDTPLGPGAVRLRGTLELRGASFLRELSDQDLDGASTIVAIAELVAAGLVASDGFAGLRAVVRAAGGRAPGRDQTHSAGRWSLLRTNAAADREAAIEAQAWSYLRRYGVVFRRVLTREANAAPWRELTRVYRRLEARGEIRGGRFVSGMSGEQFALPDAVTELRQIRRTPGHGQLIVVGAADPLNLAGIITTGDRVRAVASSRLAYCDGVPIAALEGDYVRPLTSTVPIPSDVATLLAGRRLPAVASGYVGGSARH